MSSGTLAGASTIAQHKRKNKTVDLTIVLWAISLVKKQSHL